MSNLRVLHISDTLSAAGRERCTVNLANLLQQYGYQIYLCTTRSEGPLARELDAQVGRIQLDRKRKLEFGSLSRLIRFIQTNRIQILHAHDASLFIARIAALIPPYPTVIWHNHNGSDLSIGPKCPLCFYQIGTRGIGGVITASEELATWVRQRLGVPDQRVWYLPNFIAPPEYQAACIDLPGTPGSRIVCVARLSPVKDHLTLIRAMVDVTRQIPQAHLLLVGQTVDEQYHSEVINEIDKQQLSEYVSFLGQRHDIPDILQDCTIGVLSSMAEAFPLTLLEYGTAALPVVATSVGQIPEVLNYGEAGRLVPPRSPDQLAAGLVTLLQSPLLALDLGARLQKRVQELYSPHRTIEILDMIYHNSLVT